MGAQKTIIEWSENGTQSMLKSDSALKQRRFNTGCIQCLARWQFGRVVSCVVVLNNGENRIRESCYQNNKAWIGK